jgi:hypothetical protein
MKRLFLVLLMFLLPAQFAWALAGSYCTHEQTPGISHFGHHFHAHQAQSDDGSSQSSLKLHPDCSSCFASTVGVLQANIPTFDLSQATVAHPQSILLLPSALPAEPERPKWPLAV